MFVGVCVCVFVGLLPRYLEIACINLHQTRSVGKGSDHLQLVKFWPSCAPGRGSARGENFWLRLITASAQCLRLSERFFGLVGFDYREIRAQRYERAISVCPDSLYLSDLDKYSPVVVAGFTDVFCAVYQLRYWFLMEFCIV